jgi:CheY-like chemotaxis protein
VHVRGGTDARPADGEDAGGVPLRVLLVDDDERFRGLARRTLEADGVDVVAEVGNGAEVADAVRSWAPDVVLLDIGLPDVDGLRVARRLRDAGGAPVVILISTRDQEYGERVAIGVAAGYVPKDALSLAAILQVTGTAPLGPP